MFFCPAGGEFEMRIVVAPNAFKGSLTAFEAARAMAKGIRRVFPEADVRSVPLADGGDGTLRVLTSALGGTLRTLRVTGPLGRPVQARYGVSRDGRTAVIEMAEAAGLGLVEPGRRNPMLSTTKGVGELIRHAADMGCKRILVGLGGSATTDGGLGMAAGLGYRVLDASGMPAGLCGAALAGVARIVDGGAGGRFRSVLVVAAADVTNPLLGARGAARVFAPQKGATPAMVRRLESGLSRFAGIIRRDLGADVRSIPGGGAAGGLGAGLVAFCGARIESGFDLVAELTGLERVISAADLVMTGEGHLDEQSLRGKAPVGVARLARRNGVPAVCVAGGLSGRASRFRAAGIDFAFSLVPSPMSLGEAQARAPGLLADAAERACRALALGRRLRREGIGYRG